MQKRDINVLIVDDDPTFSAALCEAFVRSGFSAAVASKPDEAISYISLRPVSAIFIDCMLPQMNGRDLAKKLRPEAGDAAFYLMSGIFKDKAFAREAMAETGALGFFSKPFDLQEALKAIESRFADSIEGPRAPFHDVLSRPQLSRKERIDAVNNSDTMDGLDLPWIYSLLMHPRITGNLNILTADGDVVGVGFQRGDVVQVSLADTRSYIGVLLVEQGFISREELEAVAQENEQKERRLGERLIDLNLASPHAVDMAIATQQGIRLSRTIASTSVKANFTESDELREDAALDRSAYNSLLHEWVTSKYSLDWLKAFYLPWMRHNLVKAQEWSETHRALNLPLLASAPGFARQLISGQTLEAIHHADPDEDAFYRRLHILVLSRLVAFGEASAARGDYAMMRKRLAKFDAALKTQNFFERLGVSQKAKPLEIKRAYHELAKVLHPDKLDAATPEDVRTLTRSAFSQVTEAYDALSEPKRKEEYLQRLTQGRAELALEAESLSDRGQTFLDQGDATKALSIFEDAAKLAPPSNNLRLRIAWAKMKLPGKERDPKTLESARSVLPAIPPEERHTALYLFVKGLYAKATGEAEAARKLFDNASIVDSDFLPAKRELNLLKLQQSQKSNNSDLLRGDLRDVVGLLFKKRK